MKRSIIISMERFHVFNKKKKLFFELLSVLLLAGVSGFLIEKEFYPTSTKSLYEIYDIPKILVNQDNFAPQSLPKNSYGKVCEPPRGKPLGFTPAL